MPGIQIGTKLSWDSWMSPVSKLLHGYASEANLLARASNETRRRRHRVVVEDRSVASLQCDNTGWLLAIGQQVGADGPDGVGRSSGCEGDQSCGPNRGQVVYRVMPRPVVSVLGELECWVTFSPRAQGWLHVVS